MKAFIAYEAICNNLLQTNFGEWALSHSSFAHRMIHTSVTHTATTSQWQFVLSCAHKTSLYSNTMLQNGTSETFRSNHLQLGSGSCKPVSDSMFPCCG